MAVARMPGDAIAGDKITYGFGQVITARDGARWLLSCNENGSAYVAKRWTRRTPDDHPPVADPQKFDALDARAAKGLSDAWKDDGKKTKGSHRERTGVLKGNASMTVTAPRANVAHKL